MAHRMGENLCKQSGWQGINLQNIQTAHVARKKKILKLAEDRMKEKKKTVSQLMQ